ncbi:MAG: acetyl/propionyl-CoA carboxylase subunit alpha [Actinomycetota bacterium]|nr:acetyl/propionyl-CoA carboxylase subunit alpha [Actinomycetota bacterium]
MAFLECNDKNTIRPIKNLLIANRGEIAARIATTARQYGISPRGIYSEADRSLNYLDDMDVAHYLGESHPSVSYLSIDKIIRAAVAMDCDAVAPGYGFLSENAAFAQAVSDAGLMFVGPPPRIIAALGSKARAKEIAYQAQVPVLNSVIVTPQTNLDQELAAKISSSIEAPYLIKAVFGGGGRGMRLVPKIDEILGEIEAAQREAKSAFGDPTLYVESYIEDPRHIEVQIIGDNYGNLTTLFERECSIQRRFQKVVEEAPSPSIDDDVRMGLFHASKALAATINYSNLGTAEFVVTKDNRFYFLEVNTRLQVEHRVTEAITGLDLVGLQLEMAMGYSLPRQLEGIETQGHAIEARIYGESTGEGFIPSSGRITSIELKNFDLVDQSYQSDDEVSIFYDSMIAKVVTHGRDRETAISKLAHGLFTSHVAGVDTNLQLLRTISRDQIFQGRFTSTNYIGQLLERADENSLSEQPPKAVVAAAAIYFIDRAVRSGGTLSNLPTSFRNLPSKAFSLDLQINEREVEIKYRCDRQNRVSFEADGIDIGPTSYTVRPDSIVIETDGLRQRFPYKSRGEVVIIEVATASIPFTKVSSYKRKEQVALGSLTTKMAGTITKVMVEVGDEVKTGETIAVIEAMKIEQPIISPSDGKVEELYVSLNQRIDRGVTVAKISP